MDFKISKIIFFSPNDTFTKLEMKEKCFWCCKMSAYPSLPFQSHHHINENNYSINSVHFLIGLYTAEFSVLFDSTMVRNTFARWINRNIERIWFEIHAWCRDMLHIFADSLLLFVCKFWNFILMMTSMHVSHTLSCLFARLVLRTGCFNLIFFFFLFATMEYLRLISVMSCWVVE